MKTIQFIIFIYYRYFSTGATADVAYIKTLCAILLLTFIAFCNFMLLVNLETYIPNISNGSKGEKYLYGFLLTAPFFAVFLILFPEKKLKQLSYSEQKIEKGNKIVLIITIAAILSLPIYLILKW
jgi:hypothetical protein